MNILFLPIFTRGRKVVSLQFFIHRKSDVKIKEIFGIEELVVPESEELAEYEEIAGVMKNERDQMYLKFESILVADFGISPIAFGEVIEKYGEKEIQKAIRVTKRAKSNGQISKNMAGFFLKAIKENYTDEAESKKEKSEKIAFDKQLKIKQLEGNLNQLTKDHTKEINKIVKVLTDNNPEITTAAIKTLREMPLTQILIKERESNLGRTLILQDFKEDKTLVDLVIGQIITQNNEHFTEMMSEFNSLSNKIRKAINQLKES
jgi:hypothetical protein